MRVNPAASARSPWEELVRAHDRAVRLSLLAMGLRPERSVEIAQATWLRLMEQQAAGALAELELPGLAIRQARFLALDELRRDAAEGRRVEAAEAARAAAGEGDALGRLASREALDRVAAVLATCSPRAQELFRLLYARGLSHADAARELGLSVQRTRQLLCETRAAIRAAFEEDEP